MPKIWNIVPFFCSIWHGCFCWRPTQQASDNIEQLGVSSDFGNRATWTGGKSEIANIVVEPLTIDADCFCATQERIFWPNCSICKGPTLFAVPSDNSWSVSHRWTLLVWNMEKVKTWKNYLQPLELDTRANTGLWRYRPNTRKMKRPKQLKKML